MNGANNFNLSNNINRFNSVKFRSKFLLASIALNFLSAISQISFVASILSIIFYFILVYNNIDISLNQFSKYIMLLFLTKICIDNVIINTLYNSSEGEGVKGEGLF